MQTFFDCLPCFVNQAIGSLRGCNATDDKIKVAMRSVFSELAGIDFSFPPPVTAQKIYNIIKDVTKIADPYVDQKKFYNDFAEKLLLSVKEKLTAEKNPFSAKVKMAIAANIIDFGKNRNLTEKEVMVSFDRALKTTVDEQALANLKDAINSAHKILFLCDNAGEIVFDRFLIEEMTRQKVTCVVRGKPVINDATIDDANAVGLTEVVDVIDNGSDAPGTNLQDCSSEFRQLFDSADIVIAKGQGNFETLSSISTKRIFYLLQVKCPVIARDIGFPVGSFVVKDNFSS